MYGPMSPRTKAMGSTAAITAKVARMVGIAHLGDRLDSHRTTGSFLVLGKAEMTNNIFDYDNCVIDQDADAKDQCKKSDAIDCVAEKVKNRHCECKRDGNSQQYDARLPPSKKKRNEKRYRERRQQEVLQQLIRFRFRSVAIITRRCHVHVAWDLHAFHLVDALQNRIRDIGRVRSLAFCDGYCHTWVLLRRAPWA